MYAKLKENMYAQQKMYGKKNKNKKNKKKLQMSLLCHRR
jgi:hypothetical protein